MHSAILFTLASGLALASAQAPTPVPGVTGQLGNAAIVEDNPAGVSYVATLPESDTTNIRGSVVGTSNANGTGVNIQVSLSGFPDASLGPFCKSLTHILSCVGKDAGNMVTGLLMRPFSVPHP